MKTETEDLFETLANITRPVKIDNIKYVVKRCAKCDFGIYEEQESDLCDVCQDEAEFELSMSNTEINNER